uniref:Integrase catalytic domain-containing protein n=1 Tax=Gadus morhua TaxID=8049 RepID=A0A8C4ZJ16_GADMO
MDKRWDELFDLLSHGTFPAGYDKSQKLNLRRYASKFTLKGELYVRGRRAIKSKEDARKLFTEFHSSPIGGHTGILKTRTAMSSRFYWLGMSKVGKPSTAAQPLQCIQVSAVWDLVGIDLIGPLPKTVDGFQYILTATDYFSKWVEAFPLKTKTAAEVGRHICSIIYRHGCPKRILSDQGKEFVNEVCLNTSLCNMLAIERSVTAAYHPQTNGLDVKTSHNIKALIKLVNDKQNNWDVFLEATLFSLRSKVQTTTKHSPFLMMYGREAVFPSEVPSQDKQKQAYAKRVQKKNQNTLSYIGEEVLWFKVKRERKERKIEPGMHGCM